MLHHPVQGQSLQPCQLANNLSCKTYPDQCPYIPSSLREGEFGGSAYLQAGTAEVTHPICPTVWKKVVHVSLCGMLSKDKACIGARMRCIAASTSPRSAEKQVYTSREHNNSEKWAVRQPQHAPS